MIGWSWWMDGRGSNKDPFITASDCWYTIEGFQTPPDLLLQNDILTPRKK